MRVAPDMPRPDLAPEDEPGVRVESLSKIFALSERGAPVSLRAALRAAEPANTTRIVRALDDVSFRIGSGERVGIIGRNGAGKTTLLSLLAGVAEPSAGTIAIRGDVHAMLTIGAVLREEATGRENIYLDGAVHGKGRDEIESHLDEVIAFAEIDEFIDRPVRTYSSGMKARLAFSMGAFINPDILIIDETLSVGDAFFSVKATRRMREIAARGRIVIVVSHGLAAINEMCTRCLWLENGRLVMDGAPRQVTRAYESAVEQADEAELAAKFGQSGRHRPHCPGTAIGNFAAQQNDGPIAAVARAFTPLTLIVDGRIEQADGASDLEISILRVDGRRIFRRRLGDTGGTLPQAGPFRASVAFDPLLLAAGLYRFDAALIDESGTRDMAHRVIEIVNEEGQFGGVPMLYCPPLVRAKIGDTE